MTNPSTPPYIDPRDELICLGHEEDLARQGGSLSPPIVQTSLFAQPDVDRLIEGLADELHHHVYTRGRNPTVQAVETKLAALERGEACKCLASGMAAVSTVMVGLLEGGDHVLFVNNVYGPTLQMADYLGRFGVTHDVVLDLDPEAIEAALRPETRMIWLESPGTMRFGVLDVPAVVALARAHGLTTVLDNSWATPLFQKPLEAGVDVVVHSASKYLGGHSDLVAGAVITDQRHFERIGPEAYMLLGAALSPHDAWLLNRGLRTLPLRMRQHHTQGLEVARFLSGREGVRRVLHPGLDPDALDLARAQLGGFGGLFSVELDTDELAGVRRFMNALRRFRIGVSWGGTESLVLSPNRGNNLDRLRSLRIPPGLVRLSVGLEPVDELKDDLARGLEAL